MFIKEIRCSLCGREIGIYQPYYTMKIRRFPPYPWTEKVENAVRVFCPECFRKHEDTMTEHKVILNHKKTMQEMKGEI